METKTANGRRTVPLPDLALRALRTAQNGPLVGTHLFTTPSGGPLYPHAVLREFYAAIETAGLARIRFQLPQAYDRESVARSGNAPACGDGDARALDHRADNEHLLPRHPCSAADRMNAVLSGL